MTIDAPPRGRIKKGLLLVLGGLLAGTVVGLSIPAVFFPPGDGLQEPSFTTVEAVEGDVGSSISLSATVSWPAAPIGVNMAAGVVTSVDVAGGDEVEAGQRLYSVNLRPTLAGEGSIPAFSAIAPGDRGSHVGQLQRFLQSAGLYSGAITDVYSTSMVTSVQDWQRAVGFPPDGIVQQGDIVWIAQLPAPLVLDTELVRVGQSMSGGEQAVRQLSRTPQFVVRMQAAQAAMTPTGTRVDVHAPDGGVWLAASGEQQTQEDGLVEVSLEGLDAETPCGDECDSIPLVGETSLRVDVITQPARAGIVLPVAALVTDASGDVLVITEAGERASVEVLATARGMAIVDGVDEGTAVRIPGEAVQ